MDHDGTIAIIGGGPAGACLAALLSRRGFSVDVYEKRADPRPTSAAPSTAAAAAAAPASPFGQAADAAKRSINLALSHRGLAALDALSLRPAALAAAVPMPCRAIHPSAGGAPVAQAYGQPGQAIHSISRGFINALLLDACEAAPAPGASGAARLHFGVSLAALAEDGLLTLRAEPGAPAPAPPPYRPRLVVGADGAFSAVRGAMMRWTRMDFARRFIPHGYKELRLPPAPGAGGAPSFALPLPHALHIWPRGAFMLIALPNADLSFTCTLFAPFATFAELDAGGAGSVRAFFSAQFGDVAGALPDVAAQWAANPTSPLMEVRCAPWQHARRALLLGDAAHSTVPFYGQGMNAALEDCLCLAEAVDAEVAAAAGGGGEGDTLERAVAAFAARRQPAGIALCDLSMGNYEEMREHTASPLFRARLAVERLLHWAAPTWWVPQYSLVAFSRVPYDEVVAVVARQDAAAARVVAWGGAALGLALGLWAAGGPAGVRKALARALA